MDLSLKKCTPSSGSLKLLDANNCEIYLARLHKDWRMIDGGKKLERKFVFKGFAKAAYHANLAAFIGDNEGHHPDICFGWCYCHIRFTSHDLGGLSENDFICAAKIDQATGI